MRGSISAIDGQNLDFSFLEMSGHLLKGFEIAGRNHLSLLSQDIGKLFHQAWVLPVLPGTGIRDDTDTTHAFPPCEGA